MRVYFAHPYDTINSPAEKTILKGMKDRGWEVLNPFEHNPEESIIERIKSGNFNVCDALCLVENDLENINKCDAVLVWIPNISTSVGTICEMVYAFKMHKRIIVIHQQPDGSPHAWVVYHADQVYRTAGSFLTDVPAMDTTEKGFNYVL